jgi:hypothetical protein
MGRSKNEGNDHGICHVVLERKNMTMKRRNSISGQFSPRLIEMLESPAYRVMSLAAHRVVSRIEIELGHHGGNDNGKLPVTTEQFVEYGMDRGSVAPAIREAEALGFIRVTQRGRGGNAEHRKPNLFYLTFSNWRDSRSEPPTNDWRKIKTIEEAEQIARAARNAKDQRAVEYGKRSARQRQQKQKPVGKNLTYRLGKPQPKTAKHRLGKPQLQARGKTPTTSISGAGGRNGRLKHTEH